MSLRKKSSEFSVLHPHAAEIDVGATFHVVAVSPECDPTPVRKFKSFTTDLHGLSRWLREVGVTSVAMESTGVYWIPVFELLESEGFEVILVNARDVKQVPGRKIDYNDAQWLQKLHQFGLLRASFRPSEHIASLRSYMRHRERLIEYAAAHIQHMQKSLMQMNLQLHHVVSDITGATGMRIIRAIIRGERDAAQLATFRDVRCKESEATITAALTGNYRKEHVFGLKQAVELYDFYQKLIGECDTEIGKSMAKLNHQKKDRDNPLPKARHRARQRLQYAMLFINLQELISHRSMVLVLILHSDWSASAVVICRSGPPKSILCHGYVSHRATRFQAEKFFQIKPGLQRIGRAHC